MEPVTRYQAQLPDQYGYINYSDEDNEVWNILFSRQLKLISNRACDDFIKGVQKLGLKEFKIPQLVDISNSLKNQTGWQVEPVKAIISAKEFFTLLANKKFPAATFIRVKKEIDYVKEPDIFHELFGHCPMLTNQVFADFVNDYAKMVLTYPESDWALLQRFFWFTVEFGLIKTKKGLRAYGGGILSSTAETVYSVESDTPLRNLFEPLAILRTPYRIDNLQPIYFVIDSFQQLYDVINMDLTHLLERAHELGEFPPLFDHEPGNPNIHINAC